jgi:hypothetical protein
MMMVMQVLFVLVVFSLPLVTLAGIALVLGAALVRRASGSSTDAPAGADVAAGRA